MNQLKIFPIVLVFLVFVFGCSQQVQPQTPSVPSEPSGTTAPAAPEPTPSADPIVIGFLGPLTGDVAEIGTSDQTAVEIAVEEINAAGGINGQPLEAIYEDGKCNPESAASAANKLVNIDQVPVIIGGLCSGETLAAAPIAESTQTVLFSPCSSSPDVTNAGDFVFRITHQTLFKE